MGDPAIENGGRREEILAAARNIFAHYGFRRAGLEVVRSRSYLGGGIQLHEARRRAT